MTNTRLITRDADLESLIISEVLPVTPPEKQMNQGQGWVYLIVNRMCLEIKLVELILHPDHIYALADRCQRIQRVLPNGLGFHAEQSHEVIS